MQDHQTIFLNFVKFDDKYLQYIRGEKVNLEDDDPATFLTIFEVGPYETAKMRDVEKLVPILLTLTLRADRDNKQVVEGGLVGDTLKGLSDLSEDFNRKIGLGKK